jgi:colicin import membrane protein
MRLTWTNSEWDNFSGVASKDNLMMLEAGDDFLNAGGDETLLSEKEVKSRIRAIQTFRNRDYKWKSATQPSPNQVEGAKKYYRSIFTNLDKSSIDVLKSYLEKAEKDKAEWQSGENNGSDVMKYGANVNNEEISIVRNASKAKANIQALNDTIIPEIKISLEKAVAFKEKADALKAKADADAKAKAQADEDAKAEADRIAKMKSLNDQLINAKTPEEKKSIQAQIDALAGNVAKGGSKYLTYGIIGLVVVVGAFMLFKKNN